MAMLWLVDVGDTQRCGATRRKAFDYYGPMTLYSRLVALALVAGTLAACAQTPPVRTAQAAAADQRARQGESMPGVGSPPPGSALAQAEKKNAAAAEDSALDADMFYRLLVGELNARGGDPGVAYSLMLDAARQTQDERLYQRAADIALQARAGDLALRAAQAWVQAHPGSRDANRYLLQILVVLNRTADTAEPLQALLRLAPPEQRAQILLAVPRLYTRSADKKLAANVVEQALAPWLADPAIGADAWVTVGRMRLFAGDSDGALQAATRAHALDATAQGPALLALELLGDSQPQAEKLVRDHLAPGTADPEVRLAYARVLVQLQRYTEAAQQLRSATAQKPDFAQGWLLLGILLAQENQAKGAEPALKRYLSLSEDEPENQQRDAGRAQAFLALAQLAEGRKDYAAAQQWLDQIPDSAQAVSAQLRRASVLAGQGRMDDARKLLQDLPGRTPADARTKLLAEVQLLREHKQYQQAYDLLAAAGAKADDPADAADLLYDQAMLAEKLGRVDEMEQLLRKLIVVKPDFHHAYNALGYSLADRNVRLDEARQLIEKALSFAPGDPFIRDSLGWVEFRAGNLGEAERILAAAYEARPDADIAAHYGEVLWALGRREQARQIWRAGLQSNADSDTLRETLARLRVKP